MRAMLAVSLLFALLGIASGTARANVVVRGTVTLPPAKSERTNSFWPRQENGIVPIAPPLVSPMSEAVIVLEGAASNTAGGGTVVMEVAGADLSPRVLPILAGTTVEFKNVDRIPHALYSPENSSFFGKEETAPGKSRRIRFLATGVYPVRSSEFPHMEGAILVVPNALFARPDDKGMFKIDNVAEGHYLLKVFHKGGFVHQQPLDVGRVPIEVAVKVPAPPAKRAE